MVREGFKTNGKKYIQEKKKVWKGQTNYQVIGLEIVLQLAGNKLPDTRGVKEGL